MSDDLQIISVSNLPTNATPTAFTQNGDKNTLVAHANSVLNLTTFLISNPSHPTGGVANANLKLSMEYYNLFVIGNEAFNDRHFTVPKDRALTESISPEAKKLFACLSDDAISQIKTLPSLFASENHMYGKTDNDQQAYFGLVSDVKMQDNGIKIYFNAFSSIPQQRLNEIAYELALGCASSFNELNRTHWTIKRVNLLEELRAAGISVLAPT